MLPDGLNEPDASHRAASRPHGTTVAGPWQAERTHLEPLLPYLPQARDPGLRIILTRPASGSARAVYENTLQMIKDMGAAGILLSGERSEGRLWPGV